MLEEHNNVLEDEENKLNTMGATRNMPASRITVLQERKKQIEETLAKRNQELRQLCIQEAELTGITPPEMPLEPGETLPHIRRRIGTSYQLPEKLVKNANNKDEMISELELEIQLHANMAEAALGLANEHNMSKTMKRQHRSEYQKHKQQCLALQEKVAALKEKAAVEQQKLKKKPRVPENNLDDTISLSTNGNEPFLKADPRHSMSSVKHSISGDNAIELRYHQEPPRPYRMTEMPYLAHPANKSEEILTSGFYRLSLNGYSKYMERRENINNVYPSGYIPGSPHLQYNSQIPVNHLQHGLSYQQNSPISQHSPLLPQHSPHLSQHSTHYIHMPQHKPQHSPQQSQRLSQYTQYSPDFTDLGHRQSSPTASLSPKSHYYPSHPILTRQNYRYESEVAYRNPHQIQPHQQYEQMNVITSGLGGYWKKTPTGELVWYSSSVIDGNWQRDRRFGSLDRRKTRRVSSRISPNMDNKSATLSTVPNYQGQVRSASVKNSQILSRRSQDNGQLVRTQSLGSVGAITVDSVYPTDDSSSYGSDNRTVETNQMVKKHKEKEWLESSLDGPITPHASVSPPQAPASPPQPALSTSQPTIFTFPSEEKFKEIPAESNPSPKVREPNMEMFNNNIPKNCTIVQAGHCKPYHEETKPFEMSDFYKYSTKFKKSPIKSEPTEGAKVKQNTSGISLSQKSLNDKFEEVSTSSYSPNFQNISNNSGTPVNLGTSPNLNTSLDLDHIAVSEHFSDEMNAWYKEQRKNNNNTGGNTPKGRSTATLV